METKQADKIVTEGPPRIGKVVLIEHGRGGLKVTYTIAQTINGVINPKKRPNEATSRPVHKEVRELFKSLRIHLLKGTNTPTINDNIKAMQLAVTVVDSIVVDKKDKIQVSGYKIIGGHHHARISTPFLESDYYNEFKELVEIVDNICEESRLFMSGTKSADRVQIVKDYLIVKKDVADADSAYANMSADEIAEITREALEDSGLRIVMEDGIEVIAPMEEIQSNQLSMVIEEEEESTVETVAEIVEPEFQESNIDESPDELPDFLES